MSSKTSDIEFAVMVVARDQMTLAALDDALYATYPELRNEERTWIGIAVHNLLRDGKLRMVGCTHDSHEGYCVLEAVS